MSYTTNMTKTLTTMQKRTEIKRILGRLSDSNRNVFMRMYSHKELEKDINIVVDEIPSNKLSWALQQCQSSYHAVFRILKQS